MSVQYGANTVEELVNVIRTKGHEMLQFSDCMNGIETIEITLDEDKNFTITID
ncbi:hypothetical protein [Bacillus sp. 1P06AnD]|uniref:hypothetical protein n=1 Tax=Bacillus sp. 1P06AnD TaxID=3132208 RepID=UPI00399F8621